MCFHMLNLCWFKHKKIFECFRCFWKVFCSSKTEKFQKQCCPVLETQSRVSQVACHSRELTGQFWRLVREWKVQSRGVHRDFCGSARDSLMSETSSREKHLENFSKILAWSVLAGVSGDYLATYLSSENRVFLQNELIFNTFLKKGLHLLVLHSVTIHFLVLLSIFQHHCGNLQSLSPFCYHSLNLQRKVWVLSSTLYFSQLLPFHHGFYVLFGIHISLNRVWLFECLMFSFFVVLIWSTLYCGNIRSLLSLIVIFWSFPSSS